MDVEKPKAAGQGWAVDPIFGDRMVLQRDAQVPVWGTAPDGERMAVECRGAIAEAVAANGRWTALLPPLPAGGPYELTVRTERETVVLRDVLFGDVWLAGGQSNMQWTLKESAEAEEELSLANFPEIRYYDVPRIAYEDGTESTTPAAASWQICRPDSAREFSAVAYHFAKRVQLELGVPIGIVGCNFGATSASCWMSEERMAGDDKLRVYLDEYQEQVKDFDWDDYAIAEQKFHDDFAAYEARAAAGLTGDELGFVPWPPPISPHSFMRPNGLYGTMLRKAAPYGLKGFLYYQGEGDTHKPLLYDRLLEALIANWRADWGDDELPFLFVQLPAFGCDGDPDGEAWAQLRESQAMVAERVPNAYMAVVLDCGEKDDIHPRHKRPVGERLAALALNRVYGLDVPGLAPVCADIRFGDGNAELRFDHVGEGLSAADGVEPIGFEIAGADDVFVPARATIAGDRVILTSPAVPEPRFVRYGWANDTKANLVNWHGLPAGSFRSRREGREEGDVAKL